LNKHDKFDASEEQQDYLSLNDINLLFNSAGLERERSVEQNMQFKMKNLNAYEMSHNT